MNAESGITHGINLDDLERERSRLDIDSEEIALTVEDLNLFYGDSQALNNISIKIPKNRVTAFIGPSGCGKSTLLRCFNRMNDLIDTVRVEGAINLYGENIFNKAINVADLRRRVQ